LVVINHKKGRAFAPTLGFGGLMTSNQRSNVFFKCLSRFNLGENDQLEEGRIFIQDELWHWSFIAIFILYIFAF